MTPAVAALRRLREFGFAGQRVFNTAGTLDAVYYTRTYRSLREVVLVYSETEALAYRARDILDDTDPLYAPPDTVEWRQHGDVVTVVSALLALSGSIWTPPVPITRDSDRSPGWPS